jgi:hypothetical protein
MASWSNAGMQIQFGDVLDAAIKSHGGMLARLNQPMIGDPQSAAISVPITTAATAAEGTDGTLAVNGAAQTVTALTGVSPQYVASLFGKELRSWTPEVDASHFRAALNALRLYAEKEVITDLVAGTAGTTATLTAGQMNFSTDGTAGEINDNIAKLDSTLARLMANVAGDEGRIFGITTPTGFGNIWSLLVNTGFGQYVAGEGGSADRLVWRGHEIFMYNGAAVGSWGTAASADAFYWVHPNAEAFTWTGAYTNADTPQHEGDGLWKKFWHADFFAGLIQSTHYATISNGTS